MGQALAESTEHINKKNKQIAALAPPMAEARTRMEKVAVKIKSLNKYKDDYDVLVAESAENINKNEKQIAELTQQLDEARTIIEREAAKVRALEKCKTVLEDSAQEGPGTGNLESGGTGNLESVAAKVKALKTS